MVTVVRAVESTVVLVTVMFLTHFKLLFQSLQLLLCSCLF